MNPVPGRAGALVDAAGRAGSPLDRTRSLYLTLLTWAFTLFSTVRMAAYLPTVWAIVESGQSSQHSVWTWCTWLGVNATMAAWLYEHNGRRIDRAVTVNACNAVMCLLTLVVIVAHRL